MRTFILLLCTTVFGFTAENSFSQEKVTIDMDKLVNIDEVFNIIQNQTKYRFIYPQDLFIDAPKVKLKKGEIQVSKLLQQSFAGSDVKFEFYNDHTILIKNNDVNFNHKEENKQQFEVKGNVTDNNGTPLPGVNVIILGSSKGTQTDFDGNYSILASLGDVLKFSYLGFRTVEKSVGSSNAINIILEEDTSVLEEVVVTAQGIKREKKALGYAVATVEAGVIESKPEADITRLLSGKVSGVEVNAGGGFLGSSANIIIRSKNSISGSNQPLYIIDGAPISGGRSFDIDPNNIASINVLKGLAASTLYGQDGRNGVIVIETKTGHAGSESERKLEVSVSSTSSFLKVSNLPDFQNKYGQGGDNTINNTFFGTWGAAFNGQVVPHHLSIPSYNESFPEYIGATTIYQPYKNNVSDFFNTGHGQTTSVVINKNFDKGNGVSFALGNTDQKGYIPENGLRRLNLSFGGRAQLTNKLSLNTSVGYTNTFTKRPTRDFFNYLTWIPRNLDIQNLPFEDPNDHSSVYYRVDVVNPRWQQKYTGFSSKTDRLFLKSQFSFEVSDNINISYLYGLDNYNEFNENWYNGRNGINPLGYLETYLNNYRTTNHRLSITASDLKLGSDFNLNIVGGFETKNEDFRQNGMLSEDEVVFNFHNHNNYTEHAPYDSKYFTNTIGVYGEVRLDYKDYAYFTVAGRNDWGSTVEDENRTLFYPSVSMSWIPSSMFEGLKQSFVDYLKFRMGYGTSANFPNAYQTRPTLSSNSNAWINPTSNSTMITNAVSSFLPNPEIKPELLKEVEFGIETRLFNNLIDLEMSAYRRTTTNQILNSSLATSTGFSSTLINAGRVDTDGIEVGLTLNLIKNLNDGFNWSMNNQFSAYETTVIDLPVDRVNISSELNYAIEGEPYGVFWGTYYARDDQNNLLINPETGKVIYSEDLGLENKIVGDPNEDWRISNINTFSYKNLTLSMQWDYIHGGDMWSLTASNLLRRGTTKDTENREQTFIVPGVLADPNTGEPLLDANGDKIDNNIQIAANDLYFINLMDVDEGVIYDASVIRLRDISLTYDLPKRLLDKTPFGNISFTFSGNNLWYYAPNLPKHMNLDPEVLGSGANGPTNGKGLDFQNDPSYKQYSLGVKLTF